MEIVMIKDQKLSADSEFCIRHNGKVFGISYPSIKEAKKMAIVLRKRGEEVEIFGRSTGRIVEWDEQRPSACGKMALQGDGYEPRDNRPTLPRTAAHGG
jgi:hypothetical protein